MEREVKVRHREAALVVSKRFSVTVPAIGRALGGAFAEVYGHIQGLGIETDGPPFVIYHGAPVGDRPFDVEVCAPVRGSASAPRDWRVQQLPAGSFATTLHVGPYERIGMVYEELIAWLGRHDLAMAGPPREVYLSEPDVPPEETRTIIEFPVSETAAAIPS